MSWGDGRRLGPTLTEVVEAAEVAGFDAIAFADHLWLSPWVGGPIGNHLEAYTTLGYIAARTTRVRLLALATAGLVPAGRAPRKTVTTLDVLSAGRAMLGIGAGDYAEEAKALVFPSRRRSQSGSICSRRRSRPVMAMWESESGDGKAFEGHHVRLWSRAQRPAVPDPAASADPDRGRRRAADVAARRALRRCLQHPALARHPAQARPPSVPVRARGPGLRRHREDGAVPVRRRRGRLEVEELIGQLRWLGEMGIDTVFGYVVGA
jgi:alkanesulfonate monooxygenase SsuD/methylene tetrahydromethanopterin reductase-like flavin-dependent oxidoreductase (luciferase family)